MNTLQKIIEEKKPEIPTRLPSADIQKTTINVVDALRKKNDRLSLIAEIKRRSPSLGGINPEMTVKKALDLYKSFASAVSVLTEKNFFGGSLDDLRQARNLTSLPLLRKDFITHTIQVAEARYYGADFYLLIVAALEKNQLAELIDAGKEFDMPALIEVHNEDELETALDAGVKLLGINNRSLKDLSIDIATTARLAARIPPVMRNNIVLISESGLKNPGHLTTVSPFADGVLIGTAFMESDNPLEKLKSMFG